MFNLSFICSLIFLIAPLGSEKFFPEIGGLSLADEQITIPEDTKGKFTFLAMASSRKAEEALNGWAEPLYYHFMPEAKQEKQMLFVMDYDVNLYFIPMFTGASKALEGKARKKAVEHMDKRLHSRVIFYKGSGKVYKKELDMKDKNVPYFFLLDKEGKIVHQTSGVYNDDKMIAIEDILDSAE